MGLAGQIVLPMSAVWMASEWGIFFATFSSRQARQHDRHSLAFVISGTGLASVLALFLWWQGIGRFPVSYAAVPWIGIALMILGLGLRWSAILTLKRFFTINVAVTGDHQLITHGPYRIVRHPSYTGTLMCLLGIGLALENVLSLLLLLGVPLATLIFRIKVEEAVLNKLFGRDYEAYSARTSRLVPGVF